MGKGKHKLTAASVNARKNAGYLSDGHGLYLKVRKTGSKSWTHIWTVQGRKREMGLGSAAGPQALSLAQARQYADKIRLQIGDGLDPFQERDRAAVLTFGEVADIVGNELAATWKSEKSLQQWNRSIHVHCKSILKTPVNSVTEAQCRAIVIPVWKRTPETGRRLRKRIETVLSYAEGDGMREGLNPARWEGHFKSKMLGDKNIKRNHFPAMPYAEVPAFISQLHAIDSIPALALEFLILTATRSNETLGALWSEIDLEAALWGIPAERMKNSFPHVVPLSPRALEIIERLNTLRVSDYVFAGKKPNSPLSNMTLTMLMRRCSVCTSRL